MESYSATINTRVQAKHTSTVLETVADEDDDTAGADDDDVACGAMAALVETGVVDNGIDGATSPLARKSLHSASKYLACRNRVSRQTGHPSRANDVSPASSVTFTPIKGKKNSNK
jgi:hypothetical protein